MSCIMKMRIACLAWGSLVWKSEPLSLSSPWRIGGPNLPIEFARVGDEGELATTLCEGAAPMPCRWAVMDVSSVDQAREQLMAREKIDPARPDWVGTYPPSGQPTFSADAISAWARANDIGTVVWTALPPRYAGIEGRIPTCDEAVAYLAGLTGPVAAHAEQYVRRTPAEIRSAYRVAIEARLGWKAL